jgi:NADH:ubiquinone oxidoreductase subunit 4 (subunit M)
MLAWTIYISFLGVLVLMLLPKGNASAARKVAPIFCGLMGIALMFVLGLYPRLVLDVINPTVVHLVEQLKF